MLCDFFSCLMVLFFLRRGLHFVYVAACIKVFCMDPFTVTPTCVLDDLEQRKNIVSTVNIFLYPEILKGNRRPLAHLSERNPDH